ncbi:trichohyalin-like [Leptidea sinapis]|uniref:trichohyalin-like n=1 Tax=Leptidea sinapis TaxID=189913 RepID=UPI0021C33F82|nr:trichohyalin-like [Leptidea sinapis]
MLLLDKEERELTQELERKRALEECKFCVEKNRKIDKYFEEIVHEKIIECQKALEREKIAKGMQCTKKDIIELKEMQKRQINEKKCIEEENREVDHMWYNILLNDVRSKEEKERLQAEKLKREMFERRMAYDEQIASANRKRREALQDEREKENRQLEKAKAKMEEDYFNAIKAKKEQQQLNKANYIKGYELKMNRRRREKQEELEIDNRMIQKALFELKEERHRKLDLMKGLQRQNEIFVINHNQERRMAENLENEAENAIREWKEKMEKDSDSKLNKMEREKQHKRETYAEDYRRYLKERNNEYAKYKQEKKEEMQRVKETAYKELQHKLNSANDELKQQIEYRNILTNQIRENQIVMDAERNLIEEKQGAFTKKAKSFADAMNILNNPARTSTNPVHPFKKHILECKNRNNKAILSLPIIDV